MSIQNIAASNVFDYVVVISNSYGSVTSAPATLGVTTPTSAYESEILALAPGNLIAYWRLNETGSPPNPGPVTAYDYWGGFNGLYGINTANGFPGGSPFAGPIYGPQPPAYPSFDITNTALQTTVSNLYSYVTAPPLNVNTNTLTIIAWINPATIPTGPAGIFFCRAGTTVAGLCYPNATQPNLGFNWNNQGATFGWNTGIFPPTNSGPWPS